MLFLKMLVHLGRLRGKSKAIFLLSADKGLGLRID
jgi:hypothetical protein